MLSSDEATKSRSHEGPSPFRIHNSALPISAAADLLGLPVRTLRNRAARHWVKQGLAKLASPPSGRGKPIWWISPAADPRLSASDRESRDEQARDSLLKDHPEHLVVRAYKKVYWLKKWRERCSASRPGGQTERALARSVVAEAKRVEGDAFRISPRTLQAWRRSYNSRGGDGRPLGVRGLIDDYNGPGRGDANGGLPHRSLEAVDHFRAIYHGQAKHSIRTCHEATVVQADKQGWQWPDSYTATVRWLRAHEDRAETCLHRKGHGEYSHRHMQHLQIDYTTIEPGELYVADHTPCDFWVSHNGKLIRPWLTAVEDCRSRCMVGWHLGPTPHQDAIVASLRMAFRDWAVPGRVRFDRGADYLSELITGYTKKERTRHRRELGPGWREIMRYQVDVFFHGILGELGIELSEAISKHPWAKGLIERFFGRFEDQCGKTFVTYCGNSAATKPDCMPALKAGDDVPTLDEARSRVADWMELYHLQPHRGEGMSNLAPIAVWKTAARLRRAVESELMALMQARGVYRVGANGVSFKIGGNTMTYGAASAKLRILTGRDVFITLDPDHCECCYAYTVDRGARKFIDRLECNIRVPINTSVDELRRAIADLRRRNKRDAAATREAPKRMRNAAGEVAALRRQQLSDLRATGTDDVVATPTPNIIPVPTGFEGLSLPVQSTPQPIPDQTRDALQRMSDFAGRADPAPARQSDSPWARLESFASGEDHPGD